MAEATRSLAWRYMICHDFTQDQFLKRLGELLEKREELAAALIGQTTTATPITPRMAEVRGGETPARRDIYFQQRLGAQQAWYVVKSAANRRRGGQWYGTVVFCQSAAAIYAIVLCVAPGRRERGRVLDHCDHGLPVLDADPAELPSSWPSPTAWRPTSSACSPRPARTSPRSRAVRPGGACRAGDLR